MAAPRKRAIPLRKPPTARWSRVSGPRRPAGPSDARSSQIHAFRIGLAGALGVGVALVVWGAVSSLATLIVYVGLSIFVALGIDPLIRWLEGKKVPRPLAIILVIVTLGLSVTGLLYWILPRLISELRALIAYLPVLVDRILRSDWVENIAGTLSGYLNLNDLAGALTEFLNDPGNLTALGGGLLSIGAGLVGGITGGIFVFILTVYFTATLGRTKRAAYRLVPASQRAGFIDIAENTANSISRYLLGNFVLAMTNGLLSAVFLPLIQAPGPLLLAVIAAFGSFVPMVGTLISSVVITAVCLTASPQTAVVAGIYYLLYMQLEAYILTPRIMDKAVQVPGPVVLVAVFAGGTLGGILGALVAVPLAASALIVLHKVVIPRQNNR